MEKYFSERSNITKEAFINAVESLGGIRDSEEGKWDDILTYKLNGTQFALYSNNMCRSFKVDPRGHLIPAMDYYTLYDMCLALLHANGTNPEDENTELEKLLAQGYNKIGHAFYKEHEGWFALSSKCPSEYERLSKLLGKFDSLVFPFRGDNEIKFDKPASNYHIQHGYSKDYDLHYFQLTPIEQNENQLITRLHLVPLPSDGLLNYMVIAEAQFVYDGVTYYIKHDYTDVSEIDDTLEFRTTSKGVEQREIFYITSKEAIFENVPNLHVFGDMSEHFRRELEWRINVLRTILPFE